MKLGLASYHRYGKEGRVDAVHELEYALMLDPNNQEAHDLLNVLHVIDSHKE